MAERLCYTAQTSNTQPHFVYLHIKLLNRV